MESLDLQDNASLFGKKFKKAMLKELKHNKIMDSLVGRGNHSQQPGKGMPPALHFPHADTAKIDAKIQVLHQKGALKQVPPDRNQFVSNLFLVPKRDRTSRPVINLQGLNTFLLYNHFNMEGIRFFWKGPLEEFACLLFGLALPQVFHENYGPVVALLCRSGIRLIIYLDDLLFMNTSAEGLWQDLATARYLLENLGFVINLEKSVFVPTQKLEFLGFVIHRIDMILVLPTDKVKSIKSLCRNLLEQQVVSVRDLSQLIGKLTGCIQAVFPAPLHYCHLQNLKHQVLRLLFAPFKVGQGGDLSVDSPRSMEWQGHSDSTTRPSNRDRCFPDRVGAVCQGVRTGSVVPNGVQATHKLPGASSRLICGEEFHREPIMFPCEAPNGQHNCCGICQSIGGNSFSSSIQFSSSSVGMGAEEQNHAQCGALCRSPHSSNWCLDPSVLRHPHADSGPMLNRSICRQVEQPASSIFQLETRPFSTSDRRSITGLVSLPELCFPPFCLIMRSLGKIREDGGELVLITPA
jgi:hypothetical protein